jgi:hypothetical protein
MEKPTMCARCKREPAAVRLFRYSESPVDTSWSWQGQPICRECADTEKRAIHPLPGLGVVHLREEPL